MIGPDVKIGNKCKIQNNVSVYNGVSLEMEFFVVRLVFLQMF